MSAHSVVLPGSLGNLGSDWLFERMAEPAQGWHIRNDEADVWPRPGAADFTILLTARAVARTCGRLAICVPRVVTGLVLGPAVYVALNGLIQQSTRALPSHFAPFALHGDKNLLLASRSHEVRDLLAESVMTFQRREWRLCQFPTFRLTRTGALDPGVYGRLPQRQRPGPADMLPNAPAIIVYDYWPFPAHIRLPHVAVVLAELAEHDSYETVDRLGDLLARTTPPLAFAVVNLHDVEKRRRLGDLGFQFITMPADGAAAGAPTPSFASISRSAPASVEVRFDTPADAAANRALADAFQIIAEANGKIPRGEPCPQPLRRAWYVLDHLATCPIPLSRYEELRRRDPCAQSLKFRLEKLEQVDWSVIPDAARGMLMARWPHIIERLGRAYTALLEHNPKWWRLAEIILDADAPVGILLPNRLAAQGLRDELLVEWEWSEYDSLAKVRSLSEARRADECFERVVLAGLWKDWQRPLVFGALPREVRVLGYPYEALVLDKRLRALRDDLDVTLPAQTATTLTRLLGVAAVALLLPSKHTVTWVTEDIDRARTGALRRWKDQCQETTAHEEDEENVVYERAAAQTGARDTAAPEDDDEVDEIVPAVTISFADGDWVTVRADRELLVLPRGTAITEQRFAAAIRPGDRVLVLSSGEIHNVFAAALARTRHLCQTDGRVVDRWQGVLIALRRRYPTEERGAGAHYCEALEALGCERDRATMRTWLHGSTMAPRAIVDIAALLRVSGAATDAERWAALISTEINHMRDFNRRLGRRIVRRLLEQGTGRDTNDRVDQEIDELLEDARLREVLAIGAVGQRPKGELATINAEEEW